MNCLHIMLIIRNIVSLYFILLIIRPQQGWKSILFKITIALITLIRFKKRRRYSLFQQLFNSRNTGFYFAFELKSWFALFSSKNVSSFVN